MDKKEWFKKTLVYTQAILEDIKSDFSPVKTLRVSKYPEPAKRKAIRSTIRKNPESIGKLLDTKSIKASEDVELEILNQLTNIRRDLNPALSRRQMFLDLEESRKRTKHLDDLIKLLKKDPDEEDMEAVTIINNHYGSSVGSRDNILSGGGDRRKPGKKRGKKFSGKLSAGKSGRGLRRYGKGAGVAGAIYMASDYLLNDRELNAENLSEDAGSLAGAVAGAEAGAMAGTAILPGIGTAVGGILGGIIGGIAGNKVGKEIYNFFNEDKKQGLFETLKALGVDSSNGVQYAKVDVDSRGRPVSPVTKGQSTGKDVWRDWDKIVEGTGRGDDKKIFRDTRGVLTMGGGVNIEAHPEYKKRILSGEITAQEAMDEIGKKEFKTLLKKRPEIAEMSYDAQQFALALAKNVGGTGASAFMPSIEAFNRGDFDTVRKNMKSWKLTDNHKRNFERVMRELEGREKTPTLAEVEEEKTTDDKMYTSLMKQIENLGKAIERMSKTQKPDRVSKKSDVKPIGGGFTPLPTHVEPITDSSLILIAGAE